MTGQLELYSKLDVEENLEKLLDIYADRLIGFINSFVKDINSSEDIMMEVFLQLLKSKPVFEDEKKLKAWLFQVARNKAFNFLKKNKSLVKLDEGILVDTIELEKKLYSDNISKILKESMERLKPKYKQVLYLSYFEEMSNQEISLALQMDERQVRNIKHRAKQKLNEILKEKNLFYEDWKEGTWKQIKNAQK